VRGELATFLRDPASYGTPPADLTVVQTHISVVALAGTEVFKVKKPVDLGFLDFSTLEKRRFFCEEEVRLNRRLCANAYRGVVPILADEDAPHGLRFGTVDDEAGPDVVDFAVHMNRLDDQYFMNRLLKDGVLGREHLARVAETLRRFYHSNPATAETSAWGDAQRIRVSVDENFDQTESMRGTLVSKAGHRVLRQVADRFLAENAELLASRVVSGMIRDCHGDLHLDHVHITPDDVCIYDCIEFNERLRYIDVANDVAFLAMDLDHHGRPDLSGAFALRMSEVLKDRDLVRLLPLYKAYRAVVRAKVAGMKSAESEVPQSERARSADEARSYFRLALQYAATDDRPVVVLFMGRVATGKSTQARMLGEALGWRVCSSDETRKRLEGIPLYERGDAKARGELYSAHVSERTYRALLDAAFAEVRAGHGVIVDATFSRAEDRRRFRRELVKAESPTGEPVTCRFIEVTAPDDVLRARLAARASAEDVVSDARLEDFEKLSTHYQSPAADEDPALLSISSDAGPEQTHARVLEWLAGLGVAS